MATLSQSLEAQNRRLQLANESLEHFSDSVVHELRSPLRHLRGFIALLQEEAPQLSDDGRYFLTTIDQSADKLGRLLDYLLNYSKLGRQALRIEPHETSELIESVRTELELQTAGRKICWQIAPLPRVEADPMLLRLVWLNLVSNAIKYTRFRPEAKIEIGAATDGELHLFYIRDNGAGFDPSQSSKLFQIFHRLHATADFEGNGVGLANVRRIVEHHGGRIWAEGKIDGGATFHFTLPIHTIMDTAATAREELQAIPPS